MKKISERRAAFLRKEIADARAWIDKCGGDLAGYVERYGTKDDPDRSGNGGEAIYQADVDTLNWWLNEARKAGVSI